MRACLPAGWYGHEADHDLDDHHIVPILDVMRCCEHRVDINPIKQDTFARPVRNQTPSGQHDLDRADHVKYGDLSAHYSRQRNWESDMFLMCASFRVVNRGTDSPD